MTPTPFDVAPFFTNLPKPTHTTGLGALFAADCMAVLPLIRDGVVDTVFADPPFNLGKKYGKSTDDNIPDPAYLAWCQAWIMECARILKPGGSFFLYNLPKWNVLLGTHMTALGLQFRHWIAVEISACLPIQGRLHPSHYSLLYYSKGKPRTFRRIRTPILTCRHCGEDIKDYGGHRDFINPNGLTLKDVWTEQEFRLRGRANMTLTARIIAFVEEHPGHTAWSIAKALGAASASVSSTLSRLVVRGKLQRSWNYAGAWVYRKMEK